MKKIGTLFAMSAAVGGAELCLDGGTAEAGVVTGNFNKLSRTGSFFFQIPGVPGYSGSVATARFFPYGSNNSTFGWSARLNYLAAAVTTPGIYQDILQLSEGQQVGPALNFWDYAQPVASFDGYFGFRFNGSAGQHYGWVKALANENGLSLTNYAWEDEANTPITIPSGGPAVPEPSSLTLLALGASGLAIYRRKRKQCEAAEQSA